MRLRYAKSRSSDPQEANLSAIQSRNRIDLEFGRAPQICVPENLTTNLEHSRLLIAAIRITIPKFVLRYSHYNK